MNTRQSEELYDFGDDAAVADMLNQVLQIVLNVVGLDRIDRSDSLLGVGGIRLMQ